MPNNPFATDPKLAFITGLTTSTMDFFKKQHDEQRDEDQRTKETDYNLLMRAMEHVQKDEDLTPSQRNAATQEIMNRSLDILKPPKHQDIKGRLAEMFGHGERYEPKGVGDILTKQRPRLEIAPAVSGGTGDSTFGDVTLPPPPDRPATYEKTYREREIADENAQFEHKTAFQLNKALAIQEARDADAKENIRLRNDETSKRHAAEIGMKDVAKATLQLRQRAAIYGDPNDPANLERARVSLQSELADKREVGKSRIEYNKRRLTQIDEGLRMAQQRMEQSVSKQQAIRFKDDPQWKGMWDKAHQDASAAKLLRTQAALAHSKFEAEGDDDFQKQALSLESQAEGLEADMQRQLDGMENREYHMSGGMKMGGVTLPAAPGVRRGGATLTEAEIRAAGGTDATVERARQRGQLAP